ncbi:MAG: hypothetical protein ACRBFS_24350 [Aureispira sp.]
MDNTNPYLQIHWKNRDPSIYGLKDGEKELKRLERFLDKKMGYWKFACVINPALPRANNIEHYYHDSQGPRQRLNKETYTALVKKEKISIYIIPTAAEKRRKNSNRGISKKVNNLDEVADHYNTRVELIYVYDATGAISHLYRNGKLLPKLSKA